MKRHNDSILHYLLGISAIVCFDFRLINNTSTWNRTDQLNLNQARKYCSSVHRDGYRCLRMFIKKETNTYNAVCGWEENTLTSSKR